MKKSHSTDSHIAPLEAITSCEKADKLGTKIGLKSLYLKREDLHPYGSHKGRSIPYMVDFYAKEGVKNFAISSSGNAALAAARHLKNKPDFFLDIFIGNNAHPDKVTALEVEEDDHIRILVKERPKQSLILAEQDGVTSLRQSTNDLALVGYHSLAKEIEHLFTDEKDGALFIGTSSGTTAQALATYFIEKKLPVQIHIVQTTSCHPLADAFDISDIPDEISIADAIVDKTAFRKNVLIPLLQKTGGKGWVVTNEEIDIAQKIVAENTGIELSANGVLGIAGAMQAVIVGHEIQGPVVCIVCGQ